MSAIKITIGIGTPRSKSKIERMRKPPDNIQLLQPLKSHNMISLGSPDRRSETRAERANQESQERP